MSRRLGLVLLALGLGSCGRPLDDGAYGQFRYSGYNRGSAPLPLFPPISDRVGNIYAMYGSTGVPQVAALVLRVAGSVSGTCALTKGDSIGAHGWVGFGDDRAWYWSGDALIRMDPGGCDRVLDRDPQTNADLRFRAVMPWVRITSTRRTLVALVQSPGDAVPFSALVDLDQGLMTNVSSLGGTGTIQILGTGAEQEGDSRVTLVARGAGTNAAMQALFFDEEANLTAVVRVDGAPPPEYGVVGTLRTTKAGTVVGLTSLGSLVAFGREGGGIVAIDPAVKPVGVHRWKDALWLVGTRDDRPVVAPIDDAGRPGGFVSWTSSERALTNLSGTTTVRNDASFAARELTWTNVRPANAAYPFLTPTSPWPHSPDVTLLEIAGPEQGGAGQPSTLTAIAPVGISYP